MKVLIIGGGGREHALAWKVAQSAQVEAVYVAPGNAGTASEARVHNLPISAEDIDQLLEFATSRKVGLTVVGPEAPLVEGIVDRFSAAGLRCFGPTRAAARLEGSKAFSKSFLDRHAIPTAGYRSFEELDAAERHIREHSVPLVIKADGLAAGKGVIIARTEEQALAAVRDMLRDDQFGEAGRRVVIEEFLEGEEASFIALVDGEHALALATSQDHKARDDGDLGPNTGGMGAYSPAPVLNAKLHTRVMREVIMPTVRGMAAEGSRYTGFLYAGLMILADGTPKVLEFNCRLGDPETQPIMLRLESDLIELLDATLDARLDKVRPEWDPRCALGVVMAAGGYPGHYRKGDAISGLEQDPAGTKVFHAGTRLEDGRVVTAGGRVLCVCALGGSVAEAQQAAYRRVATIRWDEAYFRRDIGYRAVGRERGESA